MQFLRCMRLWRLPPAGWVVASLSCLLLGFFWAGRRRLRATARDLPSSRLWLGALSNGGCMQKKPSYVRLVLDQIKKNPGIGGLQGRRAHACRPAALPLEAPCPNLHSVKNTSRTFTVSFRSHLLHPWCTSWLIYSIDSGESMLEPLPPSR